MFSTRALSYEKSPDYNINKRNPVASTCINETHQQSKISQGNVMLK